MTTNQKLFDGTITANGNSGGWIDLPTTTMLAVLVNILAGSGTITGLDMWLEASPDGIAGPFEVPADQVLLSSGVAGANTVQANVRDIVDAKTTTAAAKALGVYKHLPAGKYRVAWTLAGTTPSFPIQIFIQGK